MFVRRSGGAIANCRLSWRSTTDASHTASSRSPTQRLVIALARFAGLRIPSELAGLLWSGVNWERERFTVHAPKTERQGKGIRIVPIFPELAPYLREAWEAAAEGEDRMFPQITPGSNLRTWLGKVAARAGVELWEKPWVNMRASAATDAADKFPGHVCESWFGHSEAIANRHYRQVTEDHFHKAVSAEKIPRRERLRPPSQQHTEAIQSIAQTHVGSVPKMVVERSKRVAQIPAYEKTKWWRKTRRTTPS